MKKIVLLIFCVLILIHSIFNGFPNAKQNMVINKDSDWEQVVNHGFDNKNNLHAWSMEVYDGFLYVGTRNVVNGCQIYRSKTGDVGTWKQVNKNGFCNDSKSEGARNMIVYKDLLWVITNSWEYGTQVWVTNGENTSSDEIVSWEKANLNGFGKGNEIISSRSIAVYQDNLFVGSHSREGHPLLFRYDGPTNFEDIDPENWTLIKDWYDDPDYEPDLFLVGELVNFTTNKGKSYLYTIIMAGVTPLLRDLKSNFSIKNLVNTLRILFLANSQIWRYDGKDWELMDCEIFKKSNRMGCCFQVLNESLYIGTANWFGGEIWKTYDGESWEQVSKRGFYSLFNFWMWKMYTYENRLIVGTFNPVLGCEIWASINEDPVTNKDFIRIARHGIDGSKIFNLKELPQDGARSFKTFNGLLYTGTTNWVDLVTFFSGTGCEVWRIDCIPK